MVSHVVSPVSARDISSPTLAWRTLLSGNPRCVESVVCTAHWPDLKYGDGIIELHPRSLRWWWNPGANDEYSKQRKTADDILQGGDVVDTVYASQPWIEHGSGSERWYTCGAVQWRARSWLGCCSNIDYSRSALLRKHVILVGWRLSWERGSWTSSCKLTD